MSTKKFITKKLADKLIRSLHAELFKNCPNLEYIASVPENENNPNLNEYYIEYGILSGDGLSVLRFPSIIDSVKSLIQSDPTNTANFNNIDSEIQHLHEKVYVKPFRLQSCDNNVRCISAGMNIGHHNSADLGGTIGAIFSIEENDSLYLISNRHVLSGRVAVKNRLVSQPSENNSGGFKIKNLIGVYRFGAFGDYADVGFARLLANDIVKSGTISGTKSPEDIYRDSNYKLDGKTVYLVGSSSGRRREQIRSSCAYIRYRHHRNDKDDIIFKEQLLLPNMSQGGDSGSLLVLQETKEAVGLLFGGDEENYSAANNLKYIFLDCPEQHDDLKRITFKKFI